MGQKVNPIGFRLGIIFGWKSRWFAPKGEYVTYMLEDKKIREFLEKQLESAGLVDVEIERSVKSIKVRLHVARPGVVIGRGGSNLELLKKQLSHLLHINPNDPKGQKIVLDDIVEVKDADTSAKLIVKRIIEQLNKRFPHRKAINQAMERAMGSGAKGVKIVLSGRIGGAEIGRREKYSQGTVPTQTLRSNIDYYEEPAKTKSGYVGIKVWVCKK